MVLNEMVSLVIEKSGLIAHYQSEKEGRDRMDNLYELANAAAAFISEETLERVTEEGEIMMPPLVAFLTHASLEAGDNQAQAGQDAVQLMTVHSAKGLEFDAVFMTGLEEGLFPHENSVSEPNGLEEERRLMYVAITRARKRLYMSFAQTRMLHGQTRYNMRSRFFEELPEESLKWLSPRLQTKWMGHTQKAAWLDAPEYGNNQIAQSLSQQKDSGWRAGQTVSHLKFGEGVIVTIEGSGTQARANINFGKNGMKLLDLGVAKLEKISS
jgi:DNA helicase-2/ATP-dependent DNA helicase PcrA